jgi:hypothetical protein
MTDAPMTDAPATDSLQTYRWLADPVSGCAISREPIGARMQ